MGHKEAVELFRVARQYDLKLIFVGDPMQHGSIGRGAFLRLMIELGQVKPFRLTEILRQEDLAYRAAAQMLSEGKAAQGFAALDQLGWVTEMANNQDRYTHMAADYLQAVRGGTAWNDVLVIAPTHREAGGITQEIRSQLRESGRLGADERPFSRLVPVEASEAEKGLASTYRVGDVLCFHQNAKGGFKKGERLVVTDPAKVPLAEAGKFSLNRVEEIALAAGDVIRFTGTVHTLGKDHTIKNGDAHAVAGFTEAGNIRLDNGWVISGHEAGHYRYGFVETSIGSQGRTVKQVILGMSSTMGKAVNMQQLYVSASRSKEGMRLYLDAKEDVRDAIERDSRKLLALDLLARADAEDRLDDHRERRRRLDLLQRPFRYAAARRAPEPPTPPLTHAARHQARQQQGDYRHAR
jgi:ATP-dependent exoDNAse (exonuclease V) alpha subunit